MSHILNLREQKTALPEIETIEWQAPEFEKYYKKPSWFIAAGIIALALFIVALIFQNYIFVFVVILSFYSLYFYGSQEPATARFTLNHRGVQINQKLFPYTDLKSFWLFYEPPELKQLTFQSKKNLMPYMHLPLDQQSPVQIRSFLIKYLPEQEIEESLIDVLSRKIGF